MPRALKSKPVQVRAIPIGKALCHVVWTRRLHITGDVCVFACLRVCRDVARCLAIVFLGLGAALAAPPDKFVLGTDTEEQVFSGLWERLIYTEAFKRLGIPLEVAVAPLKRLEIMLEQGEIDGEMMRGPAYAEKHPNLIVVDLPLMPMIYSIYALKPVAGLSSLDDLRVGKFSGAYRRGVLFCENMLAPLMVSPSQLNALTSVKQGMEMLAVGHADFFCDLNLGMLNYEFEIQSNPSSKPLKPLKLFDISKPVSNSAYLHQRHAALALKLEAVLKQMKKEGLVEKYRLETIARLSHR